MWQVFSTYNTMLARQGHYDFANPGGLVLACVQEKQGKYLDSLRFDHVFIDEVQDFDRSWLLAMAPIPRTTLTMAGDLAQRIYKRSFTWQGVGIQLPPARSRKLVGSHRTTQQIMDVAKHLVDNTGEKGSVEGVDAMKHQ